MEYLRNLNPIILTLLGTLFTFILTTLGSSLVFFFKKVNDNILSAMMSLSSGIMIAASFFSLLNPAINLSNKLNLNTWFVLFIGFFIGAISLYIIGLVFDKYLLNSKRSSMLFLSISLHNIPEGMVVGVSFASLALKIDDVTLISALLLTLGIGIQNFPEGSAVALPLRCDNYSRLKAFVFGSLSGFIEIIAGLLGCLLALKVRLILPYLLSFAAGAMIYVVSEELIPASMNSKYKDLMAILIIVGFSIMMILDIALG